MLCEQKLLKCTNQVSIANLLVGFYKKSFRQGSEGEFFFSELATKFPKKIHFIANFVLSKKDYCRSVRKPAFMVELAALELFLNLFIS